MQQQLDLLDTRLKDRKAVTAVSSNANLKFAQKIQKPPMRPSTPINATKPVLEIKRAASALVIQKIIRGRISQNLMYHGKERRKELISELRIRQMHRAVISQPETVSPSKPVHSEEKRRISSIDSEKDQDRPKLSQLGSAASTRLTSGTKMVAADSTPKTTDNSQEFEYTDTSKKTDIHEVLAPIQSEYTARSIDFLTKELVRLRQEQLISAVVRMAERTRRMREGGTASQKHRRVRIHPTHVGPCAIRGLIPRTSHRIQRGCHERDESTDQRRRIRG
jgi:hypothetical protein